MGDRELLYVVLAVLFFGGLNTSINRFLVLNSEDLLRKEYEFQAVAVAQEIIETVKSRRFDENITPPTGGFKRSAPPLSFASPFAMRSESEKWPYFDDVDDFGGGWKVNGYRPFETTVATDRGVFHVSMIVYYVDPADLEQPAKTRKYYKKLIVTVSNEYLAHDITLEHVYSFINLNKGAAGS